MAERERLIAFASQVTPTLREQVAKLERARLVPLHPTTVEARRSR